jgi:mannosyl-3-phosphoglycerate phosphatase
MIRASMLPEADLVIVADVEALLCGPQHASGPAAEALLDTTAKGVPLVFCSTRTRAEIEAVQKDLGFVHPFICESGAAVFVPAGYFGAEVLHARRVDGYDVVEFGPRYADVVASLRRRAAAARIDIVAFHNLSAAEIAAECGLSVAAAERAKQREYGEAFRFVRRDNRSLIALRRALRADKLTLTCGGWFEHVGPRIDEGQGISLVRRLFERTRGPVLTVGFGDPLADVSLLRHVDVPITTPLPFLPRSARLLAKACRCATPDEHRLRRRVYQRLDAGRSHLPTACM